jgi:Ca2+-binding RTX toxin-like protein
VENANGTFTYTPVAGFFGTDSFTYTLKDGSGLTATGMVNITVNGTAKPPVANSDSFTGTENHTVTGNVMTNDTDPNGLVLSVTAATMTTAHGSVVQNADGTFIYTPSTDFTGTDNFSYTLNDSAGLSATGTASITINAPAPTGPVVNGTNGADSLNADHTLGTIVNGLGGNDTIQGHDGNDTIYGGDGNDKLYGYWGNDVIYGGAGSDTLSGSYGSDTFTFKAADLGTGVDKISDFSTSAGDKINISDVLSGHFNPATDILTNFVNIVTSGSNSILEVDLSGHAGASGWAQVATISGVTNLDEQLLVHKGNLIV